MRLGKAVPWTTAQIDEAKRAVREALDRAMAEGGAEARLAAITSGLDRHESAEDGEGQLLLFVYVVSALVHHERYGGLTPTQVSRLATLGSAVLKARGVQPETSKLAFLHGELHLALSQIHRKNGEHWSASWEQQLAFHLARRCPPGDEAFRNLAVAIRALRLGHGERALEHFERAEAADPAPDQREKARIGRVRTLRLTGRPSEARQLVDVSLARDEFSRRTAVELQWEALCLEATATGDLRAMMQAVQKNGTHYEAVYLVEAFLWASAVRERSYVDRLPKMQTLARKKELSPRDLGFFLKVALQIEACYDVQAPFALRLTALGALLGEVSQLVSIDRELLFQAAAARWLGRNRAATLAATAWGEYEGTSLALTRGRSTDVLGVGGDWHELRKVDGDL